MRKANVLVLAVLLVFLAAPVIGAGKLNIPPNLPSFTLEKPASAEVQKYLGLQKMEPFGLSQIQAKIVIMEVMSAL
ncbi:MAG: hypothetical protein H6Q48_2226 [Deltaproteobacteria bacterium]|nr:hypothetical protein [Deltaproteobacteria bacterium]